jgi:hypothetical protein
VLVRVKVRVSRKENSSCLAFVVSCVVLSCVVLSCAVLRCVLLRCLALSCLVFVGRCLVLSRYLSCSLSFLSSVIDGLKNDDDLSLDIIQ